MSDIVPVENWSALLKQEADRFAREESDDFPDPFLLRGAADEITRLRAALAEHESGKSFTRLHEIADRWCDKAKELEEQLAEAREIIKLYAGSRLPTVEQPQPGSLLHRARAFLAAQEDG